MKATRGEAGFTLAEVLVSAAILTVLVVGLMGAMTSGTVGLEAARRHTTALFLAEQRLEEAKARALSGAAGQGWASVTAANFPDEAYGAIPGYSGYRRTVVIGDNPGGTTNTKLVEVRTFYRQITQAGVQGETGVLLSTMLVNR